MEGLTLTGVVIALAIVMLVCVAQILSNIFLSIPDVIPQ